MRTMTAKEAKDGFGALLDAVQHEPVTITKKGREVAVALSKKDFEWLEALEDAYWGERAMAAHKEGYLSAEETEALLKSCLDAAD